MLPLCHGLAHPESTLIPSIVHDLQALDPVLRRVRKRLRHADLRGCVLRSVLAAAVRALQTVLETRRLAEFTFSAEHIQLVRADVQLLQRYFVARDCTGEVRGIDERHVLEATAPVEAVIDRMVRESRPERDPRVHPSLTRESSSV